MVYTNWEVNIREYFSRARESSIVINGNEKKRVIPTSNNIYYFSSNPSNLINLAFLNNNKTYPNKKNETFYNSKTKKILGST